MGYATPYLVAREEREDLYKGQSGPLLQIFSCLREVKFSDYPIFICFIMPKAFLITNRRYHELSNLQRNEIRDPSPERRARTADGSHMSEPESQVKDIYTSQSRVGLSRAVSTEIWQQILNPFSVYDIYGQIEPLGLLKKSPEQIAEMKQSSLNYINRETSPQPFSVIRRNHFYHYVPDSDHEDRHYRISPSDGESSNYENLNTPYSNDESNSSDVGSDDSALALTVLDNHVCPECGKRYSTSSNLARHRQTHRSECDRKARKCPHCDKVYVSTPAYSMHVRTHSQGCQCVFCGKCFSRPWLLQGHIRTHTGEKPFKCPICTKAFADKSNLRAHIQTHSTSKPYVCERCGKAFALKSYLYKHEESSCMRVHRNQGNSNNSRSCSSTKLPVLQSMSSTERPFTVLQLKT